jgi:hypothetical protein
MEQAQAANLYLTSSFRRSLYRLGLTSNLPSIAALCEDRNQPSDFVWTGDHITNKDWHLKPGVSAFASNLNRVLEHSTKWVELCTLIQSQGGRQWETQENDYYQCFPCGANPLLVGSSFIINGSRQQHN